MGGHGFARALAAVGAAAALTLGSRAGRRRRLDRHRPRHGLPGRVRPSSPTSAATDLFARDDEVAGAVHRPRPGHGPLRRPQPRLRPGRRHRDRLAAHRVLGA